MTSNEQANYTCVALRRTMDANSRFLVKSFRRYYRENPPPLPHRFGRREFGFMFFDRDYMQRHTAFPRGEEMQSFLVSKVPSHCYHSTAYYQTPGAPTMEEKTWMGADLIFDLDADHLHGAEGMSYGEMLEAVKKEMLRLLDDYLFGDLGFTEDEVRIVFSGGRGYHAHVRKESVLSLGSPERREIVDYITGNGLQNEWVFPFNRTVLSQGRYSKEYKDRTIPGDDSGGWRKRMRVGLVEMLDVMEDSTPKELKQLYPVLKDNTDKAVAKVLEELYSSQGGARGRDNMLSSGMMAGLTKKSQEIIVKVLENDVRPRVAGEVDEPVTTDVKRLIRLPGSLHGKSGLRVVPLSYRELLDFDALRDAVPSTHGDEDVRVEMRFDADVDLRGETFKLSGEETVPSYLAVYLLGRRMADLVSAR